MSNEKDGDGCEIKDKTYPAEFLNPFGEKELGLLSLNERHIKFDLARDSIKKEIFDSNSYIHELTCIPLFTISEIKKIKKKQNLTYQLEIICKDFRQVVFNVYEREFRKAIVRGIEKCFQNPKKCWFDKPNSSEWSPFNPKKEFERQKIGGRGWKIHHNKDYRLCETYCEFIAVPENCDVSTLTRSASFRSKNRLPVLSWQHPDHTASIVRCSQPLTGAQNKKCDADEQLVKLLPQPKEGNLLIFDARPKINAMANRALGGGVENPGAYGISSYEYLNIPNIHVMRHSYNKLHDLCFFHADDLRWLSKLDETNWLTHIKLILYASHRLAESVENQSTVLLHCSDGWDRTSQMSSLAMLMLDPYYRTIDGFAVLVEKEWCSFGHKFADRIGHANLDVFNERAPIFLQFIDCVWQMTEQFRYAFQFNEYFLRELLDGLYSCRFGNFLYNSERERRNNNVYSSTVSIWSELNSNPQFLNPLYKKEESRTVIYPQYSQAQLQLWINYYIRWNPNRIDQLESENCNALLLNNLPNCSSIQ